jgi:hypothetical protein
MRFSAFWSGVAQITRITSAFTPQAIVFAYNFEIAVGVAGATALAHDSKPQSQAAWRL